MNPFQIIEQLYVNRKADWILNLEEAEIQPFIIQRFLVMNDAIRVQTRWLDKYAFNLPPRMYLSLAWSVVPKYNKAPFIKYIKKADEEEEFDFILKKIRRQFMLADNDYAVMRTRLIDAVKNNMPEWFKFYGVEKGRWKKYYLNFKMMKESEETVKEPTSLSAWGM